MTDDKELALTLLQSLNLAVLRREASGKYSFFGNPPAFYDQMFPRTGGEPSTEPWNVSTMLEFFHDEAETFFALGEAGVIGSGVWEEEGLTADDTALIATAINFGDDQLITVRLLEDEYTERLDILRRARQQLLENRRLASHLSIFKEKSRIDGLTSIFNRETFVGLLQDEIRRSEIMDYPLVLMILDIDDFKKVNDAYGHLVGDKVLQAMGGLLKTTLRRNDIIARYGGEEFAVLLPHAPINEALHIAEKMRAALAAMDVPGSPRITVSIGCTAYLPDEPAELFFKRADDAMYKAKRSGKNRVCS